MANYATYEEFPPHPYLREPKLYVSGLSGNITKEHLGDLLRYCVPFRPMLQYGADGTLLPGYIEFRALAAAEKALATLQNRPLPIETPTCNIVLSPFLPTTPPTSLPPPSALPRLVKQLPAGITDSELYDLFRPFGPLANVRSEAGFGPDIGVVEFWSEEDAQRAEEAMHCAEVGDQNMCVHAPRVPLIPRPSPPFDLHSPITTMASMLTLPHYYPQQQPDSSIQVYQPRRAPGAHTDFSANAPPFVPASLMYQQQQPTPPQNVSQPFFPPHLSFAIPPPVTPQPLSNILSLSSPPPNAYPSLPPQHSPTHSPNLGAQQLSQYPFQPQSQPPTDMYGMGQQQQPQQPNTYGHMTGSTPPQTLQPTPPMTPQRHLQNIGPHHPPYNPMFSTPPNHSRPGQQVQYAPPFGPGSGSQSGLIDPCNLFIKNLDPNIDSNELFTTFRRFGHIVSARVMRTESGQSRGFGFVSYQTPDQASGAMNAMNGTNLGTKPIIVRLHEPKQLRQEKLANRYSGGRNPHPRSASGATSPSPSDPGETQMPMERARRSSGSYYQAALAGTLGLGYQQEELSALSPVVRKDVLTGELTRQVKALDTVSSNEVTGIVDHLVTLSLTDVVEAIHNQDVLKGQVAKLKIPEPAAPALNEGETSLGSPIATAPQPVVPETSQLLEPAPSSGTPAPPASAPDHPSTPFYQTLTSSDPSRTSSPSGSQLLGSEQDRLLAAVTRADAENAADITKLLMDLSKRERAMCLFNAEYLRHKISDAKLVLEALAEEAEAQSVSTAPTGGPATPAKSARGLPPAMTSSTPAEVPGTPIPEPAATVHTLASLARLPAVEIIKLANSPNATGLPLPKADPAVVKSTDEFIDGLNGQSEQQKKQVVGTKLFKAVKAFGIRNAKITIHLLDTEDLRALTHLMNSYPSVLKEKVQQAAAATSSK
ncbi:hypothetical protein FRB90_003740 [Tulasnella sp. 427]|nr:hypothetical protein FRB90_003740 [Tulasnella sp. 427]